MTPGSITSKYITYKYYQNRCNVGYYKLSWQYSWENSVCWSLFIDLYLYIGTKTHSGNCFSQRIGTCASLLYCSRTVQWFDPNLSYLNVWGQSWLRNTCRHWVTQCTHCSYTEHLHINKDTDTGQWERKKRRRRRNKGMNECTGCVLVCVLYTLNIFLSAQISQDIVLWPLSSKKCFRPLPLSAPPPHTLNTKNPRRSAVSEILQPVNLTSTSMPRSKSQRLHFLVLMLDVNINWSSWPLTVRFYALCHFHTIGWFDNCTNKQVYMCSY